MPGREGGSMIKKLDLTRSLSRKDYDRKIRLQARLREHGEELCLRNGSVAAAYEVWDAGKGERKHAREA
jgi:hypothetical protein